MKGAFGDSDESRYAEMNGRLHGLIVEAAGSKVVSDMIVQNEKVPFVAAGAIAFDKLSVETMFEILRYAHRQHHAIVRALENGEGARVEALLREHTHPVKESLNILDARSRDENGPAERRIALAHV